MSQFLRPRCLRETFRSLAGFNYRVWAGAAFVSNVGTWMQRVAQDWLVFTQLTHRNATAVGVVMALQFGPQMLLLPWTGLAADRFDRRKLLVLTQSAQGLLAAALGILTVLGVVQLWQVYAFALLVGCTTAFDAPARQIFVEELVDRAALSNAIALNSTSFSAARMIGPALAGLIIAAVGTGWTFITNAISFAVVVCALSLLRVHELHASCRAPTDHRRLADDFRYLWNRPDLTAMVLMLFFMGTFGFNFAIFISTMVVSVFHQGPGGYGLLSAILAVGTFAGALTAAARSTSQFTHALGGAAIFGVSGILAAVAPDVAVFAVALVIIGVSALTFVTSTNTLMQISTEPAMRGRVIAIRLAVTMGGTTLGAPIVGWIADSFGPRCALGVGAASGLAAAGAGINYLIRHRRMRVSLRGGRLRVELAPEKGVSHSRSPLASSG